MERRIAVPVTAVLLVVAAGVLLLALDEATVNYLLPTPGGATRHTKIFGPGVLAAVLAGIGTLLAVTGLILAVVGRLRIRMLWWVVGAVGVALLLLLIVAGLDRPTF